MTPFTPAGLTFAQLAAHYALLCDAARPKRRIVIARVGPRQARPFVCDACGKRQVRGSSAQVCAWCGRRRLRRVPRKAA